MIRKLVLFLLLISLLLTGCGSIERQNEDSYEDEESDITSQKEEDEDEEDDDADKIIVHNADELIKEIGPGKHIYLEPGDYDLQAAKAESKYFGEYGEFMNLKDVTLEGKWVTQVDFFTQDIYANVLAFQDCQDITLINLNMGHKPYDSAEVGGCEGMVLCFFGKSSGIDIRNCTMFGCGVTGLFCSMLTDLTCTDSVIKECSSTIMTLDSLSNAKFRNCRFERNESSFIDTYDCKKVVFEDCFFTGFYETPYFTEYQNDGYETIYQSQPGTVKEETFKGITLKNVTFSIDEAGAPNAVPNQQASQIKKDLEKAISGSTCQVDFAEVEMTGSDLLNLTVNLQTLPTDALLVDTVKSMMTVLTQYELQNEMELTIQIYDDNDDYCYLDYIDVHETLVEFVSDPESIVAFATYASFSNTNTDFNTILNTSKTFMSIEKAIEEVRNRYTDFVKYYGKDEPVAMTKVETTNKSYQKEYGLYYMVNITIDEIYLYYYFDAATGDMIDFFEGNPLPVSVPSPELRKAALDMYVESGFPQDADDIISLYQVGNNLISIQTIDDYYHYYHFKQQDGKYSFEEYIMPAGE